MLRSPIIVLFGAALLMTACTTPSSHTVAAPEATSHTVAAPEATSGNMVASHGDVASAPAAVADEDDPIVCKKVTQLGSRVARRTCMRQSQIEKNQRYAKELLEDVQNQGAIEKQTRQ